MDYTNMFLPTNEQLCSPTKMNSKMNLQSSPTSSTLRPGSPTNSQLNASNYAVKTPVSMLQEMYSRRGMTPKYELVQIEGAVHEPTFMYRVTVSDVVATGTGHSKKEAKHAAAKAILDKIVQQGGPLPNNVPPSSLTEVNTPVVSPYDDKVPGNPVGSLQELCMARRKPPPEYKVVSEEGLPHERQFTIACIVSKLRETGCGKSKKLAKRQAAHKMLELLKALPMDPPTLSAAMEDDDEIAQKLAATRYLALKDIKLQSQNSSYYSKAAQFHRNLRQYTGDKLAELQNLEIPKSICVPEDSSNVSLNGKIPVDFIQILTEISTEQNLQLTYIDIDERSFCGNYQCLLQISTVPLAVCYGTGLSEDDARMDAARNTLEYLKVMTRK